MNLYDSIVLKDILMRNNVTSAHTLERVIGYVISSSSLTISASSISKALKASNLSISVPTVYEYIKYCVQAHIIHKVERYDIRGKRALSFEEIVYASDLGLFRLKKSRTKDEFGLITETLVHNEFVARGYSI